MVALEERLSKLEAQFQALEKTLAIQVPLDSLEPQKLALVSGSPADPE